MTTTEDTSTTTTGEQQQGQQTPPEAPAAGGGNAEAAKYRRELRDTQAELATVKEQLITMRRVEVERLAEPEGVNGAALWASGVELDDLLNEDGTPNTDAVTAAVSNARTAFGIQGKPATSSAEGQGAVGESITGPKEQTGWAGALRGDASSE
ncbi:hypothetical protein ACQXVK_10195 [Curtobacterium sp. AB451]|uniref:hypothetical protein n=1 Tax=Curtobacterium sp. AB451 TaxID=3422306 RepID=UPI003D342269